MRVMIQKQSSENIPSNFERSVASEFSHGDNLSHKLYYISNVHPSHLRESKENGRQRIEQRGDGPYLHLRVIQSYHI